jgi:ATP-dependent helicase/nuclease subunit B
VPLDDEARASAQVVASTIDDAIASGFLPAAPKKDACRWCDYSVVCGPYEEMRSGRKSQRELQALVRLRGLR